MEGFGVSSSVAIASAEGLMIPFALGSSSGNACNTMIRRPPWETNVEYLASASSRLNFGNTKDCRKNTCSPFVKLKETAACAGDLEPGPLEGTPTRLDSRSSPAECAANSSPSEFPLTRDRRVPSVIAGQIYETRGAASQLRR